MSADRDIGTPAESIRLDGIPFGDPEDQSEEIARRAGINWDWVEGIGISRGDHRDVVRIQLRDVVIPVDVLGERRER